MRRYPPTKFKKYNKDPGALQGDRGTHGLRGDYEDYSIDLYAESRVSGPGRRAAGLWHRNPCCCLACPQITSDPCLPNLIADSLGSSDGCGVQCIEQHGPIMACIENGSWRDPSGDLMREVTLKINHKFFKREF